MKEKFQLKFSTIIELIGLILIFVIPALSGIKNSLSLSVIILLVAFSRSTPFSRNMMLGYHSFLSFVSGHVFGWKAALFIGVLSTILVWRMSKILGGSYPVPVLTLYDAVYLSALGIYGAFVPIDRLVLYGLIGIVVGKHIIGNVVRGLFSPEPFVKHAMLSFLNLFVNYLWLTSFSAVVIGFFG